MTKFYPQNFYLRLNDEIWQYDGNITFFWCHILIKTLSLGHEKTNILLIRKRDADVIKFFRYQSHIRRTQYVNF